jgi:hypothetical protein
MDDENTAKLYSAIRKPRKCPNCGKMTVVPIIYGLPSDELFKEIEQKKFLSGGCCGLIDDPEWGCTDCGAGICRVRRKT